MEIKDVKRKRLFLDSECLFLAQMKKDGLLNEEEYNSRLRNCTSIADQLSDKMKKHGEWKNHDTTISFQHKTDNYLSDKVGKIAWPEAQWDSEQGSGFLYCHHKDIDKISMWLMKNDCSDITTRRH